MGLTGTRNTLLRNALRRSALRRSALAGLAGFVAYGGWAYFANMGHGDAIAMRSGLVQGSYSLVLTFLMTLVTEGLFARLRNLYLTTGLIAVMLFSSAYTIHMAVGTPEILMTILPGWVIGTVYTMLYILGFQRSGPNMKSATDGHDPAR